MPTELLIADDHPLFREALRGVVARVLPETHIHEADQLSALCTLVDTYPYADLLLLDLDMPGTSGFNALSYVRTHHPQLPVVIVSAHEDPMLMRRAIDLGALGFIPKSSDMATLAKALEQVLAGNLWLPDTALKAASPDNDQDHDIQTRVKELTPQQFRILQLVSEGQLNKQIAYQLGVSEATVKAHMTAIMRKLGVATRTQAVLVISKLDLNHFHD